MNIARPIEHQVTGPGEQMYGLGELLYTRTDERGIIRAGNEAFRRVSGYSWEDLIGAPHKIVRNPDTPKGVFWLLWRGLKHGNPMAGYIKNRSQAGGWYWAFASITPVADGYISIQIKPAGQQLALVRDGYAQIVTAEQEKGISAEKSAGMVESLVRGMGFRDYSEFMIFAFDQEVTAREAGLSRAVSTQVRSLNTVGENLKSTRREQTSLLQEFDALQSIPTNMRIIASRLEPSGGPISAISDNYKFASSEIWRKLGIFAGSDDNLCSTTSRIVGEALFLMGYARLQAEVVRQFKSDDQAASQVQAAAEMPILSALEPKYLDRARAAMVKAEHVSGELNQASAEIRRMMLGLDTIRVMGRVESGRLGPAGVGLAASIDQLDYRHAEITARLQVLMDLSAAIKSSFNFGHRKVA